MNLELTLNFNKNLVSVIFLENIGMLKMLSEYLKDNMYSRVSIIKSKEVDGKQIFKNSFRVGLLNVVIVKSLQKMTTYLPFTDDLKTQQVDLCYLFNNDFRNIHGFHITAGGTFFEFMESFENKGFLDELFYTTEKAYNLKLI